MEKPLTIEESLLKQVNKKKRKRRNKRIARFALLVSFIVLIVAYLSSDMSKVKSLTVKNNVHFSDEQILELAGIDYDSNYILTLSLYTNLKLEKNPLIADAKLKKDLHGGFTILVEEEKVLGSLKDNPELLLIQGKGVEEISNISLKSVPRIGAFSDDQLLKLNESFEDVDSKVITMISEILPHSESYNSEMVRIIMNDGNRITSSYDGIYLINNYKKILPQLEGTHVCLFMDELSGNIIKQSVDCTQPTVDIEINLDEITDEDSNEGQENMNNESNESQENMNNNENNGNDENVDE